MPTIKNNEVKTKKLMPDLRDFLSPVSLDQGDDEIYVAGQLGRHISKHGEEDFDYTKADIVFVGVSEWRGQGGYGKENKSADIIRKQLYRLFYWHTEIRMADMGNVKTGESLADSYAAVRTVLVELYQHQKTVVIIGGSHDMTLAQYHAYRALNQSVEVSVADARIDLNGNSSEPCKNFLMEMFTGDNNILNHYNHLAFQSYYVHPLMLETIDKLRFDCYRLGNVQENIEDMEPVLRNSNMLSFDISAIKFSDAPANKCCPNGLSGTEACTITRFAGMSENLNSLGIYGYDPADDTEEITAIQAAQMIWYFIDGRHRMKQEAKLADREHFNEFHTVFAEVDTTFLQSKKTKRWWMQMPDGKFIACSENDYRTAGRNDFPERWLRVQERN